MDRHEIRYTLDGSDPKNNSTLYAEPITYSTPIQLIAQCYRHGTPIGFPLVKMFSTGFGDQCMVLYTNPYHESYAGGGDKALFNNKFATARGDDPNWQGLPKEDFDIIIDLAGQNELSYIALNFFQHIGATSVMLPTNVKISISEDGKNYQIVLDEFLKTTEKRDPFIKKMETEFKKQEVGFIKITAKNRGTLPEWHIRNGDAWIFVDEISVK